MGMNSSLLSYEDCVALFDQALADARGIRVPCDDLGAARKLISRLHYCRTLVRKENREVYPDLDHPMHGKSEYDRIVVRLCEIEDKIFLYLERINIPLLVENLSEIEDTIKYIEAKPVLAIEYKPTKSHKL